MNDDDDLLNNIKLDDDGLATIFSTCALFRKEVSELPQMLNDAAADKDPGNMFMRLFYIALALGQNETALDMQTYALKHRSIYRVVSPSAPKIRLLALVGDGDPIDNTPIDFLVEHSDIQLDLLFISSENENYPSVSLTDYDVIFVALCESAKNRPVLRKLKKRLLFWRRPYINHPEKILNCARHKTAQLLQNIPGLFTPQTYRTRREQVGEFMLPLTLRPIDTHKGESFEKINSPDELKHYLNHHPENDEFYISEFVDYQSHDGLYRKLRIALIDRKPFICHLAISENWIVHYTTSKMEFSEQKRAEEKAVMENFDGDFAVRHGGALSVMADRLDLDYVVIDCAETQDGDLLLFEADTRCWVHATDPVDIFPYKPAIMQKAFDAFRALLLKRQKAHVLT